MSQVLIIVPGENAAQVTIPAGYPDALKLRQVIHIQSSAATDTGAITVTATNVPISDIGASLTDRRTIALGDEVTTDASSILLIVYDAIGEKTEYESTLPGPT